MNVPQHLQQYVDYINNASGGVGSVKRAHFDEDFEPIGERVVVQLYAAELVTQRDGMLTLVDELCRASLESDGRRRSVGGAA